MKKNYEVRFISFDNMISGPVNLTIQDNLPLNSILDLVQIRNHPSRTKVFPVQRLLNILSNHESIIANNPEFLSKANRSNVQFVIVSESTAQ